MRANVAAVALALLLLIVALAALLASLPGRLDELLLAHDGYCSNMEGVGEQRRLVQIDYGDYVQEVIPGGEQLEQMHQQAQQSEKRNQFQHIDSLLWRLALHLWDQPANDDDSAVAESTTCSIGKTPEQHRPNSNDGNPHANLPNAFDASRKLHPICEGYRTLRTRLRFERLVLPWNWHYRVAFRVRGLTLHSLAEEVAFVPRQEEVQSKSWLQVLRLIRPHVDASRVNTIPRRKSNVGDQFTATTDGENKHSSHLPPSAEVDTMDVSFQSWRRPIISMHLSGITINAVIQKGELALPRKEGRGIEKLSNTSGLYLGAMSIPEVLYILPKPPEVRGLYPRIGLVNITNVSLRVYENHVKKDGSSSVKMLLEITIPDKFFRPITNLTSTHKHTGIDRKDLQPMMETCISHALRRHLLREATAAFRNSWSQAHKFVEKTHELYIDRWIEMGTQAWHQTQQNVWQGAINGTAPLKRAVEDWVDELKEILSEPGPPLAVVVAHYWNRTIEGMHKHGVAIKDKKVWGHLNEMITKSNVRREKRIAKHLGQLRDAFDGFGSEMELLFHSCEMEVKEIWLAWHRQFLPEM